MPYSQETQKNATLAGCGFPQSIASILSTQWTLVFLAVPVGRDKTFKLWPVITSTDGLLDEFNEAGSNWSPPMDLVAHIPMRPGDVLYMPAGELI